MKLFKWIPCILLFSCIDVITQTTFYNSLYFKGGSWIETAIMDSMKTSENANDFTLQFWVSGSDLAATDGPALFSLIDLQDSIKLALYRDSNNPSTITAEVNSVREDITLTELNWSDADEFYLISLLFSDNLGVKGYVDSTIFLNKTSVNVTVGDAQLMFGAKANKERTILENFWYGYIDEIRLWNTRLADSTIKFQALHPDKLGDYYRHTYHDSLIGLWRFNLSEATTTIRDESESEHIHDGIIYTLPNYSIELSEKGAQ